MKVIKRIKHDGACRALVCRIDSLIFGLTNRNWDAIKKNDNYCRLGDAISDAEIILRLMRDTLTALQKLAPKNR